MSGALTLLFTVLAALGITLGSADVGLTMNEYIDKVGTSHSYTCDDLSFNQIKDTISTSDVANTYITYDDYRYMQDNAANPALTLPIQADTKINQKIIDWVWTNLYSPNVVVSATDIANANGSYVRFDYVLDNDYYNKWGKERYIFTAKIYSADNVLIETVEQFNGLRYAFSQSGAVLSQQNSYYDPVDNTFHLANSEGKVDALVVDVATYLDGDIIGAITPPITGGAVIGTVAGNDIASDGTVTLPDGTKVNPNEDGTYTIDGQPYAPSYDLSNADTSSLVDLLNDIVGAQSQTQPSTADYTSILSSLRSILSNILTKVSTGFTDLLQAVKGIPSAFADDLAISAKVKNDAISDLKKKVGYSALLSNVNVISTTFFGERTFNDKGEVIIAPVFDTGETITAQRPHLYFTLFGKQYDLFSGFYMVDDAVATFKSLVSVFIICAFVVGLARALPSIILNAAEYVGISNPTAITNTFSNFGIYQQANNNKPPKIKDVSNKKGE